MQPEAALYDMVVTKLSDGSASVDLNASGKPILYHPQNFSAFLMHRILYLLTNYSHFERCSPRIDTLCLRQTHNAVRRNQLCYNVGKELCNLFGDFCHFSKYVSITNSHK
jgi:hypothetical protein